MNDKLLRVDTMGDTAREAIDDGNPSQKFGPAELFHQPQVPFVQIFSYAPFEWIFHLWSGEEHLAPADPLAGHCTWILWPCSLNVLPWCRNFWVHLLHMAIILLVPSFELFEVPMPFCPTPWVPLLRSHPTSFSSFFLTLGAGLFPVDYS